MKNKTMRHAVRLCMRLDIPQHGGGLVAYDDVIRELVEINYFRSGLDLDEQAFRQYAHVPAPTAAAAINKSASANDTLGMRFAYRVIGERLRGWVSRSRFRAEIISSYGLSASPEGGAKIGGGATCGGAGGLGGGTSDMLRDVLGTAAPVRHAPRSRRPWTWRAA